MNSENFGRTSATPINQTQGRYSDNARHADVQHVNADGRRVTPETDLNTLHTNDTTLNKKLQLGEKNPRTDLTHASSRNISAFAECQRLVRLGDNPQQIVRKLGKKGIPAASIKAAMKKAVPEFRRMPDKHYNQHWKTHLQPSMRSKQVIRGAQENAAFKKTQGIPQKFQNSQGINKIKNHTATQAKNIARAKGTQERGIIGQNRADGMKQQAFTAQHRQATQGKQAPRVSGNRERYNPAAARARAEQARKTPTATRTQSQSRTVRR